MPGAMTPLLFTLVLLAAWPAVPEARFVKRLSADQQPAAECKPKANPGSRRDYYVLAVVFSGRKDRESILLRYLRKLVETQQIDEVRLAMVGERIHKEDAAWLSSSAKAEPHTSLVRSATFPEAYAQLQTEWKVPDGCEGRTVIMKVDDDIVYVDLEHFSEYTRFVVDHPEYFLVHANVVNNGVAAYYQQQRGLIPASFEGVDLSMEYPAGGGSGSLWQSADKARALHKWFVQRPESFSFSDPDAENCISYHPPGEVRQGRFSINWFGFLDNRLGEVVSRANRTGGDEVELTATNVGNRLCMHTRFVVSHLSFFTQTAMDREAIGFYRRLADRLLG